MTDITDAAMLQAKLMHAKRCSGWSTCFGVAHEVNNPLTAILGFADLLMKTRKSLTRRARPSVILQEAQRTKQIVQNLLSFAARCRRSASRFSSMRSCCARCSCVLMT